MKKTINKMFKRKVVINIGVGSGLGSLVVKKYAKIRGLETKGPNFISEFDIERDDPVLVKIVEESGNKINCETMICKIVEIPRYINWIIEMDEDGREYVEEAHRCWGRNMEME